MRALVVIPTLDRPRMCARAVDSLMAQTCEDWSLVIAKNGGTECLGSYVAELGPRLNDERVKMLVLPQNGLGYALNEALDPFLAGHRAWANLEDDDEWHPYFLEVMLKHLKKGDVAHCLQKQVPRPKQSNGGKMNASRLKWQNWINWPMCLWSARVYSEVGPIAEDCGAATDWDWHLRCVRAGMKYVFVDRALVTHHWHPNSGSPNYCLRDRKNPIVSKRIEEGAYD